MKVAMLGGTFDPIHLGHLIIAEQAYNSFELDKVIFMPAGIPPHKDFKGVTGSRHRLEMVELAIKANPHFVFSDWELKKNEKSYTVDTLKYIQSSNSKKEIYLILGADSLFDIYNWKEPEYILEHTNLIVASRPGFPLKDIITDARFRPYSQNISFLDDLLIDISSSHIRDLVRRRKSIRYLVTSEVETYIKENKLYQGD